jgi:hypothetical protein
MRDRGAAESCERVKRRLFNLAAAASLVLCVLCATQAFFGVEYPVALSDPALTPPFDRPGVYSFGGLLITRGLVHSSNGMTALTPLAFWLLAAVFSVSPILRIRAALRESEEDYRRSDGLCPTCGYDLRATPERCPECGAAVPAHTAGSKGSAEDAKLTADR